MMVSIPKVLKECFDAIWQLIGRRYRYVNIYSYVANNGTATLLHDDKETTVYSHSKHYERICEGKVEEKSKYVLQKGTDIYDWLACLTNAKCFPYSDLIITADNRAIYDIKNYKQFEPYANYEDGVIWKDRTSYCKIRYFRTIDIDKAFFLGGLYAGNYYHFMTQIAPKFKYISEIPSDIPLLLPPHCEGKNNFREVVDLLVNSISPHRSIMFMRRNRFYRVKELYVASTQSLLVPDLKDNSLGLRAEWCSYKPSAIEYVRSVLLPLREQKNSCHKKIYILRKSTNGLRQYNESEISDVLQMEGFTAIAPEDFSIREQIMLFNDADQIIASSGAALTNLMFCHPGCKLLIINSFVQDGGVYNTLADLMHIDYLTVNAQEIGTDIHQSFTMNPEHLLSAMRMLKMMK